MIVTWLAVALLGFGGFVLLAWLAWRRTIFPFDQPVLGAARAWDGYAALWNLLSVAAYLPLLGVTVLLVLWMLWKRLRREALLVVIVLVLVTAGSETVKQLVARPRPPGSDAVVPGVVYSFPSGHELEVATIFGIILVLVWRSAAPRWAKTVVFVVLPALMALVAIARMSLNAHYPSDVLAGFLGAMGVVAVFALLTQPALGWTRPSGRRGPPTSADARSGRGSERRESHGPAATVESTGTAPGPAATVGSTGTAPGPASAVWSTTRIVAGFVAVGTCLVVLGVLAEAVRAREADAIDAFASPFLHHLASPALDAVMQAATFLGSTPSLAAVLLAAVVGLVWLGKPRDAGFVALSLGGSVALNGLMKAFFQRPRPRLSWAHVLPDYSFPSGHAMESLALFLALALVAWQIGGRAPGIAATVVAVTLSFVVGLSRIYLGYHYVSDVLGGYVAALLWLFAVVSALSGPGQIRARRARPGNRPAG